MVWRAKRRAGAMPNSTRPTRKPTPRLRATGRIRFSGAMHVSFNLAVDLEAALKAAATLAGLADAAAFVPEVRTADPKHGDFQANGTLGYAKARKQSARNSGKLSRTVSQIVRKSTLSGSEDTKPVPIDLALHPGVARRFYHQIDFRIEHL